MARRPRSETEIRRQIGTNVRRLRNERGWTQAELAAKIGTKTARISELERATADPHISTLIRFARALSVCINQLLTRA